MPSILRTAVLTDLGLRRGNNEDCAYAGRRLLAVADGMGGLPAGELASDLAIAALRELDEGIPAAGGEPPVDEPAGDGALARELRAAFEAANGRIRAAAAQDDEQRHGMGTTVTAVLFGAGEGPDGLDRAALMHVGDSRGYLFRDDVLTQLTKDDTYVQALVDQGVITPDEARRHPQRSLVTQAMQGQPLAPSVTALELRAGDVLLLCSDGLSDVVTDDRIAKAMAGRAGTSAGLDECARALVDAALAQGAPDNVTVVLAELLD